MPPLLALLANGVDPLAARTAARPKNRYHCSVDVGWLSLHSRTHIFHRPQHLAKLGEHGAIGQPLRPWPREVDHFWNGVVVVSATSTLFGLMSRWMTPFWWACCRLADLRTIPTAISGRCLSSTVPRDRHPTIHGEVGRPLSVVPASAPSRCLDDHHCHGLPLGLETGDDLPRVHSRR